MQTIIEHTTHALDAICTAAPVILLAMLGGIVRAIQSKECGLKDVTIRAAVSGFAAIIMHLLVEDLGLPSNVVAAICGITGYSAVEVLRILTKWVCTIARGGKEN